MAPAVSPVAQQARLAKPEFVATSRRDFFRVVAQHLARWKFHSGDSGQVALKYCMVVARHYVVAPPEGKRAQVSLAPAAVYDSSGRADPLLLLSDSDVSYTVEWEANHRGPGFSIQAGHELAGNDVVAYVRKLIVQANA